MRGDSALQINAFAAPKRSGIWSEVRSEIAEALQGSGGRAAEVEGSFGTELHAAVPTELPGQGVVLADARFVGVDGPRWFLRGLLTGPAATDAALAAPFEAALRDVVVLRGGDAMAVRDPLPLRLPRDVDAAAQAGLDGEDEGSDDGADGPDLSMPVRGPEITEVR